MPKRRATRYLPEKPTFVPPIQTYAKLLLGSEKSSEMWRRECEARTVLRWTLAKRREYIAAVETKRGPMAAAMLKDDMLLLWNSSKD
jgi:hypothetical protein